MSLSNKATIICARLAIEMFRLNAKFVSFVRNVGVWFSNRERLYHNIWILALYLYNFNGRIKTLYGGKYKKVVQMLLRHSNLNRK